MLMELIPYVERDGAWHGVSSNYPTQLRDNMEVITRFLSKTIDVHQELCILIVANSKLLKEG